MLISKDGAIRKELAKLDHTHPTAPMCVRIEIVAQMKKVSYDRVEAVADTMAPWVDMAHEPC